ncbi:UNVERIFIED_CONTAM: hypothetical protein Sindi_2969000 [Sesamum indicum]
MAVVRDFLKTNTFTTTGRSNQLTHLSKATRLVKPKLKNFAGFQESFDRSRLDITLDGDLQPYPAEPDLKDDEFAALRKELEDEDED